MKVNMTVCTTLTAADYGSVLVHRTCRSADVEFCVMRNMTLECITYGVIIIHTISGVASYGALGHCPSLDLQQFHFRSLWSRPKADSQILCSLQDQLVQMSTTHSSFDQYCISHKTISHQAAAAPGPEVRRECPMT